jgi:ComEC/Rec2-related protein
MLLGDQGEVTPLMRQNLARTGTSHLLVINGLHLGMVALVTYFLSFWLLRCFPRLLLRVNAVKIATLLAAIPVVFYAWVAGGSPSTQRAEVMVLAYLLLVFLGRPGEVWSALALAALIILSLWPLRLFSISFQLSFAAVAFLIYLVPRLVEWIVGRNLTIPSRGPLPASSFASRSGLSSRWWPPWPPRPGGPLLPGGLPPGHPGQPGGHSLVTCSWPCRWGGRGHRPALS